MFLPLQPIRGISIKTELFRCVAEPLLGLKALALAMDISIDLVCNNLCESLVNKWRFVIVIVSYLFLPFPAKLNIPAVLTILTLIDLSFHNQPS